MTMTDASDRVLTFNSSRVSKTKILIVCGPRIIIKMDYLNSFRNLSTLLQIISLISLGVHYSDGM